MTPQIFIDPPSFLVCWDPQSAASFLMEPLLSVASHRLQAQLGPALAGAPDLANGLVNQTFCPIIPHILELPLADRLSPGYLLRTSACPDLP